MRTVPQEFKPGQNESRVLFDEHKQEVCLKLSSKEDVWISNLCIENRLLQCKACKRLMEAAALKHWCSWSAITHHYPEEFSSWATFSYSRRMNRFLCSFASDTVSPVWFHGILSKRIKKKQTRKIDKTVSSVKTHALLFPADLIIKHELTKLPWKDTLENK